MHKNYILIGAFVAIVVAGFGYQSYATMHDTETSEQTQDRLMREGKTALGLDKQASSTANQMASGSMRMEDGVMMETDSMKTK